MFKDITGEKYVMYDTISNTSSNTSANTSTCQSVPGADQNNPEVPPK